MMMIRSTQRHLLGCCACGLHGHAANRNQTFDPFHAGLKSREIRRPATGWRCQKIVTMLTAA
jgi:hypothetical protein